MFPGLEEKDLSAAVEAMLFVSDEPVSAITLADVLAVKPVEVELACVDLRTRLEQSGSGIELQEVAGGWRLVTRPEFHSLLERYVLSWDTRRLSPAMLEVLAVIAYTQPVTRQGVANVRGVNSDSSIGSLVERGLVREAGCAATPGNPVLYATTRTFLEKFGLRSLDELPDLEGFAPDDETRRLIAERLSATRTGAAEVIWSGRDGSQPRPADADAEPLQDETVPAAMGDALAQATGVVEKIDFDELRFDE